MRFFKEFSLALKKYTKVLSFVVSHKIWSFFTLPLIFNGLLLSGYLWLVSIYASQITTWIESQLGSDGTGVIAWLISVTIYVFFIVIIFYTYQFISLIILAPVYSHVSENVQQALTGVERPFSFKLLVSDVIRGVKIAVQNVLLQLMITIIVFVISIFLPFIAPIVPFVLFFVGAYFQGFSMIDYRNEYHNLDFKESRRYINAHKGLVIGNGVVFQLFLLIPIVGTIFAPVFSIVSAALAVHELEFGEKK
ncbi:MAG: hypothetical protein GY827_06720 [Cytophagales bacterium]|nr:hypothetical protein [Cytophagales bacterium]